MQGRGGRGERYREVPFGDEEQLPPVVASHPGARQQVLEDFDYCSRMLDAAGCTERERVCFLGRHWWDQGDGELSKLTGRSEETIRTARASATRKLRALFEQRGG